VDEFNNFKKLNELVCDDLDFIFSEVVCSL
jgi:hypothetical protein